jgi:hypothetical protein
MFYYDNNVLILETNSTYIITWEKDTNKIIYFCKDIINLNKIEILIDYISIRKMI